MCKSDICPQNICPYQQYLSCHWPNFDQTFLTQYFSRPYFDPKKCGSQFHWTKILMDLDFEPKGFWTPNSFLSQKFVRTQNFWDPKHFDPNILNFFWHLMQNYFVKNFVLPQIFLDKNILRTKNFVVKNFWTKYFLRAKFFLTQHFLDP